MYCQLHDVRRLLGVETPTRAQKVADLHRVVGHKSKEVRAELVERHLAHTLTQERVEETIEEIGEQIHELLNERGYKTLPVPNTSPRAIRILAALQAQLVVAVLRKEKEQTALLLEQIKVVHLLDAPESVAVEAEKKKAPAKQEPPPKGAKKDGLQKPVKEEEGQ